MKKPPNENVRTDLYMVRVSKTEKALLKKLAEKSKAKTISGYIRAAALNRPGDDRAIFREMLKEQIKTNAELKATPDWPEKKQILTTFSGWMRWIMGQK